MHSEYPSFVDEQAAIENLFFWEEAKAVLAQHAGELGVQLALADPDDSDELHTQKVVLVSTPVDSLRVHVWGSSTREALIGRITLSYQNSSGIEQFAYYLLPESLTRYSRYEGKQTQFTRDEVADLRADLQEEVWDLNATAVTAKVGYYKDMLRSQ